MLLADFISKHHDGNLSSFARAIDMSKWPVKRYCVDRVPSPAIMLKIVRASRGLVGPDDFYPQCARLMRRYRSRSKTNNR